MAKKIENKEVVIVNNVVVEKILEAEKKNDKNSVEFWSMIENFND